MQQARDQSLVRKALRERPLLDRLQVLAREPDVQPSILSERRLGVARVRVRLRLPPLADFHSPRSTDSSNSFSSASIFMVVGLLTEILLRGLPARYDCLQEDRVLVLDERHQVHIVLPPDDEDTLASVTAGVRMFENVEQVAPLDVEDDVLEPDAALRPSFRSSRRPRRSTSPPFSVAQCVLVRHTLASAPVCPRVCPNAVRGPSSGSQRQPRSQ